MKRTKIITLHFALPILSLVCLAFLVNESINLCTLIHKHQTETEKVTVEGKTISSDLYGNLEYYAVLEKDAESRVTHLTDDGDLTEVSRQEFSQLNQGDTIDINKNDSTTERTVMYQSIALIAVYMIAPIYYICFLIARYQNIKTWKWLSWPLLRTVQFGFFGILAAILIYGYGSMGKIIYNTFQAYTGGQYETKAIVTDREADINGGRFESNYYYLSIMYRDQDSNTIYMTKEVRPSVYNDSLIDATISFPEDNPYHIHVKGFSGSDILFYFNKLWLYVIVIILTSLLTLVVRFILGNSSHWRHRRKRRIQSRKQSLRDRKKHRTKMKHKRYQEKERKRRNKNKTRDA
ncbi:hypothetical protein [Terribacillus halophilus]|uniref:hypothetical protein n=1 Tax=Terribacillus halophilus TaxID=361279 RepID=UPI00098495BE|nr:hypothetical protein [Terribacillus halophilus]